MRAIVSRWRCGTSGCGSRRAQHLSRSGGGWMVFVWLPSVGEGFDIPAETWEDRRVRAVTEMAAMIVDWDTDIFSWAKETDRTGDGFNLVDVLANHHGCSPQEAAETAMAMRDRV